MVGVVVRVDDVGHLVGHVVAVRDRVDGALQVVPDGRGRVEQHDPLAGGEERGHVGRVGDVVQVLLHLADVVAVRVEGMTQRSRRDRRVVGQGAGRQGVGRGLVGEGGSGQCGDCGDGGDGRAKTEERTAVRG